MLERYDIVSLKNIQDAGAKLDAWQKKRQKAKESQRAKNVVSIRAKSVGRSRGRKAS